MIVNLDVSELWYLLERCLHGSHLRSGTIERFTNEFYEKLEEHERMRIFEWSVRIGYAWNKEERNFSPSSACCGQDIVFMKRYHPLNQYRVYTKFNGAKQKHRAFKMNGEYYISSTTMIHPNFITKVEKVDLSEQWERCKVENVDYDTNILE